MSFWNELLNCVVFNVSWCVQRGADTSSSCGTPRWSKLPGLCTDTAKGACWVWNAQAQWLVQKPQPWHIINDRCYRYSWVQWGRSQKFPSEKKINFNFSFPADSFVLRVGLHLMGALQAAAGYQWLEFTWISLIAASAIICLQSQRGSFWSLGMRENEVSWQPQNSKKAFGGFPITVCE